MTHKSERHQSSCNSQLVTQTNTNTMTNKSESKKESKKEGHQRRCGWENVVLWRKTAVYTSECHARKFAVLQSHGAGSMSTWADGSLAPWNCWYRMESATRQRDYIDQFNAEG